jgi:hypothetical protein
VLQVEKLMSADKENPAPTEDKADYETAEEPPSDVDARTWFSDAKDGEDGEAGDGEAGNAKGKCSLEEETKKEKEKNVLKKAVVAAAAIEQKA